MTDGGVNHASELIVEVGEAKSRCQSHKASIEIFFPRLKAFLLQDGTTQIFGVNMRMSDGELVTDTMNDGRRDKTM